MSPWSHKGGLVFENSSIDNCILEYGKLRTRSAPSSSLFEMVAIMRMLNNSHLSCGACQVMVGYWVNGITQITQYLNSSFASIRNVERVNLYTAASHNSAAWCELGDKMFWWGILEGLLQSFKFVEFRNSVCQKDGISACSVPRTEPKSAPPHSPIIWSCSDTYKNLLSV
jgi:hypothetical protein